MAVDAFNRIALCIEGEALGAESHSLVEADILSDYGGLSYYHSRAVVDEETLVDLSSGVNIDSGLRMGYFRDDPRNERYLFEIEKVGDPVIGESEKAGVGEYGFSDTVTRRVSLIGGFRVAGEEVADRREGLDKASHYLLGPPLPLAAVLFFPASAFETEAPPYLLAQRMKDIVEKAPDVIVQQPVLYPRIAEVSRKEDRSCFFDAARKFYRRRHGNVFEALVINAAEHLVGRKSFGNFFDKIFVDHTLHPC
jgi:hypothetical protein